MASWNVRSSLHDLPDEVIQNIIRLLPPNCVPAVELTSRRLNRLANEPLLWRRHCHIGFKHWDSRHNIRQKFAASASAVDWKDLFTRRYQLEQTTTKLLEDILTSQTDRIRKIQEIIDLGYDVKDVLLRHHHVQDGAEDVLARRSVPLDLY